jgi:hypothetical protein
MLVAESSSSYGNFACGAGEGLEGSANAGSDSASIFRKKLKGMAAFSTARLPS